MRSVAIAVLLATLLPAAALARDTGIRIGSCEANEPVHWAARHDAGRAHLAIPTEQRTAELILTREVVAMQLSDRVMHRLDRKVARERHENESVIGSAIRSAVLGSVRSLLDHSLECPLDELRDVRYRNGRLELITHDGDRIFEDLEVNEEPVLESFRPEHARAFVREFHRLKRR